MFHRTIPILLLCWLYCIHSPAQYLYDILLQSGAREGRQSIALVPSEKRTQFLCLIDSLFTADTVSRSRLRRASVDFIRRTDSINFERLSMFARMNGIPAFKKKIFPDSLERIQYDYKKYILSIHLTDFYGLDLIRLYERSVQMGIADERDLMNYFITYLWRKTEFGRQEYQYYIVPLPNLFQSPYSEPYLQAMSLFIRYVRAKNDRFQLAIIPAYKQISDRNSIESRDKLMRDFVVSGNSARHLNLSEALFYSDDLHNASYYKWYKKDTSAQFYLLCNNPDLRSSPPQTFVNK